MKRLLRTVVVLLLFGMSSPLHAQWLKHPTPGLPRTSDGAPNLSAPAPRTADGKPDFSGVWGMDAGPSLFYIPGDLKPGEIKPWAEELVRQRGEHLERDDQAVRCLPGRSALQSFRRASEKDHSNTQPDRRPFRRPVVSPDLPRRTRAAPDPSPSFMGYSVGRWEGDTLVVESIGFKDVTWLDFAGHPHSEALRLTERYRRLDFGHMEIQETFQDADIYSRPLTVRVKATLVPDTDLLEFVCAENERDRPRLVGTLTEVRRRSRRSTVAPAVLARYVGTYDFRFPENPTIPSLMSVTLARWNATTRRRAPGRRCPTADSCGAATSSNS